MASRRLPPLHAVRAFEAAARHLSITRAADELNVTVGAVSRHVRALELRMGTALFLRGSRGLVLTSPARRSPIPRARHWTGSRTPPTGCGCGVSGGFRSGSMASSRVSLLPIWPTLKAAHPDLEIDLHTSSNPLDLLASRFDAVIAVSDGQPRAGLVTHPLMPISTVPVCSPDLMKNGPLDLRPFRFCMRGRVRTIGGAGWIALISPTYPCRAAAVSKVSA